MNSLVTWSQIVKILKMIRQWVLRFQMERWLVIKTRYRLLFVILSFLLRAVICYGYDDDWQLRTSAGIAWEMNKDWTMSFREELRSYGMAEKLFQDRSEVGVLYKSFADWLDVGANYTIIHSENSSDEHTEENRASLSAIVRGRLLERDISDRLRIEYRDRSNDSDIWRFRNKFTIDRGYEGGDNRGLRLLKTGKIKPYVADEIFVSFDGTGFSQNMVYLGFVMRLTDHTKTDVYYGFQSIKTSGEWDDINVIGIEWTYHF
jgi:hypothetical protein